MLGYADLCVAPILNRPIINSFSPPPGSPLALWHQRISQMPCIKETFAEVEAAAPLMAKMGPEAWKQGAGRKREDRDDRLEWMVKNGGMGIVQRGIEDGNVRFSWPYPQEDQKKGEGKL
ncbi:putative glutathione S-transferase domain superfamily [Septoria linicola]|nr:putative glutathione S-transferase domain superfamily [Septoria linicola]